MFICPPRGVFFPLVLNTELSDNTFPFLPIFILKLKRHLLASLFNYKSFFKILFILKNTRLWPKTKNVTETVTSFLR